MQLFNKIDCPPKTMNYFDNRDYSQLSQNECFQKPFMNYSLQNIQEKNYKALEGSYQQDIMKEGLHNLTKLLKKNDGYGYAVQPEPIKLNQLRNAFNTQDSTVLKPLQMKHLKEEAWSDLKHNRDFNKSISQTYLNKNTQLNQYASLLNYINQGIPQPVQLLDLLSTLTHKQETFSLNNELRQLENIKQNKLLLDRLNLQRSTLMFDSLNEEFKSLQEKWNHISQKAAKKKEVRSQRLNQNHHMKMKENQQLRPVMNKQEEARTKLGAEILPQNKRAAQYDITNNNLFDLSNVSVHVPQPTTSLSVVKRELQSLKELNTLTSKMNGENLFCNESAMKFVTEDMELSLDTRSTNTHEIMNKSPESLDIETVSPCVSDFDHESKLKNKEDPKIKIGPTHQTAILDFSLDNQATRRKNLKCLWSPELLGQEEISRYLSLVKQITGENNLNEEKTIRLLSQFGLNVDEATNHIRQNKLFYKNNLKVIQRTLRSHALVRPKQSN